MDTILNTRRSAALAHVAQVEGGDKGWINLTGGTAKADVLGVG
jgi:hypothetical protein